MNKKALEQIKALQLAEEAERKAQADANPWGIPAEMVWALNAQAKRVRRRRD